MDAPLKYTPDQTGYVMLFYKLSKLDGYFVWDDYKFYQDPFYQHVINHNFFDFFSHVTSKITT